MFGRRRRAKILRENEAKEAEARFEQSKRAGKAIYVRIAELKTLPRENLPDAVFLLLMEAKQQTELIRRSIRDRTRYDFNFAGMSDGDPRGLPCRGRRLCATASRRQSADIVRDDV